MNSDKYDLLRKFNIDDLYETCVVCKKEQEQMFGLFVKGEKRISTCSKECFLTYETLLSYVKYAFMPKLKLGPSAIKMKFNNYLNP